MTFSIVFLLITAFARSGGHPPEGFMEPEAWKVLAEYYQNLVNNVS